MIDDRARTGDAPSRHPQHVGRFRFFFESQHWEWSDEVAELHGYRPGEVNPTTELVVGHKHPDDRESFVAMLDEMITRRTPFSSRHRIVDRTGDTHHVVVIAQPLTDTTGATVGTEGFYLDVSDIEDGVNDRVAAHVSKFREHNGVIEQAKGMIMLAYGVDADRAFEVLKWLSQNENVKLHDLCRNVVTGVHRHVVLPENERRAFDNLLLTAHQDNR